MKKSGRSQLRRRSAAQRAAIDARADAWSRPPSATQSRALALLVKFPFKYTVAGWCPVAAASIEYFSTQTMEALKKRGFARKLPTARRWLATKAGRKAARR